MKSILLIFIGKCINFISRITNLGGGSTWPGHIALSLYPQFIQEISSKNPNLTIILIAGTNGKTTTAKMITAILESKGKSFFQNSAGANLLNGVASSFIEHISLFGRTKKEFAIFEIDENTLPLILKQTRPYAIIILNLFRDQLDRYGELNTIAKKWKEALVSLPSTLPPAPLLILNADDPLVASIGEESRILYFGLPEKRMSKKEITHGADSMYCPTCGNTLVYTNISYSHLGNWRCTCCKRQRPKNITKNDISSPLPGLYNEYNTQAAATLGKTLGLSDTEITAALKHISPAFGRQELITKGEKNVHIFLSKNPTSFNQSLETIIDIESRKKTKPTVLFVLNDRIPDGTDVSWIWDTDLESHINKLKSVIISGDRCYDMGLRVFYSRNDKFQISRPKDDQPLAENSHVQILKKLKKAIIYGIHSIEKNETLYVLPTYSAMLEVRKILTGKKIL